MRPQERRVQFEFDSKCISFESRVHSNKLRARPCAPTVVKRIYSDEPGPHFSEQCVSLNEFQIHNRRNGKIQSELDENDLEIRETLEDPLEVPASHACPIPANDHDPKTRRPTVLRFRVDGNVTDASSKTNESNFGIRLSKNPSGLKHPRPRQFSERLPGKRFRGEYLRGDNDAMDSCLATQRIVLSRFAKFLAHLLVTPAQRSSSLQSFPVNMRMFFAQSLANPFPRVEGGEQFFCAIHAAPAQTLRFPGPN
jgi:hypothetical protein